MNVHCKLVVVLYLTLVFLLTANYSYSQTEKFSREDTLRGSITPERAWWDVTYYHLDVRINVDQRRLDGSVLIQYRAVGDGTKMQIDLQPPLQIKDVLRGASKLPFEKISNNVYIISLPEPLQKNATDSLRVYYGGNPVIAKNPPWEGGFQFSSDQRGNHFIATSCQGLGASVWWPNKDHSSDEPDSMRISVTVPDPLIDVSNGRLRKILKNADSTTTYDWFVSNPINNYGVNVNAARYVHFSDTLNGEKGVLDLDFYVLPENLEKAREQFKQAKLMLRAFEHWFGPYPFYEDGYKLVETPYLGMEHQSSVTYGNGYQNGYRGRDLSGTGWGLKWDFIIIHESGHEWFANNITYQDIADMWIHESFTNYSEALFTEYYFGTDAATDYVVGTRRDIRNDIPIIGVYNVNQRGSGDMYPKGGNMLHTIRHSLGDDSLFRQILRGMNVTFYHKTVTTKEIENYISQKSGIDFSKVFDQYLRTVKIPELQVYQSGRKLHYRWANVVEGFAMPIRVVHNGREQLLHPTTSWQSQRKQKVTFDKKYLERMYYITVTAVDKK
jgi:aminopeptidase N